jgi:ribosomal protein L16 Arg81 hydroxylase
MITFLELWYFIETTNVTDNVLQLIDPNTGSKISSSDYIIETFWEKRFNIQKLKQYWELCYTFIVHGSCITPSIRQLIEEVESDHNVDAQAHIYTGKVGSKSFSIHCDNPDNLIVQCIGKSRVTIYNEYGDCAGCYAGANVTIKEHHILEPGNSVFIPSLQYHLFEPLTDRLSISIPMYKK